VAFKRNPPPGNMRRVASLGNNFRGVTTNKQGRLVQFESEQEHKLVLLLERDPTVADYVSQPEALPFQDANGQQRTYIPDFKVWRSDGRIELHEVTVEARRQERHSLQQREAAASAICLQRGWRYVVHTDQTLPSGYQYANLDFLAAFRARTYTSPASAAWWLEQLVVDEVVYPQAVLAQAGPDWPVGILFNCLYHLIWHGAVQMDWDQPFIWQGNLHPAARVWLAQPRTGTRRVQEGRS
jgi:hypothetical protein